MIGIYNTITIDNTQFVRPSDVVFERVDVFGGEYETCTGAIRADLVGWKYADITLAWDTLTNDQLTALTALSGAVTMTFTDSDGLQTETVIRRGFTNTPTRFTLPDGTAMWRDVSVTFTFTEAH